MYKPRVILSYYFRQHMYTLVPRHVREDMQWMADTGTTALSLAVLEQDLKAATENLRIIIEEAHRAGMKVFATPSRWGGLFAGAPKVPSIFTANHPDTWMIKRDGQPYFSNTWGPMSSVHHPATWDFFRRTLDQLLAFDFAGIIWDEPKALGSDDPGGKNMADFSPAARAKMPPDAGVRWHVDAFADFIDRLGEHARSVRPSLTLAMFVYAHLKGYPVERMAQIKHLDYFGCDGRPWSLADTTAGEASEDVKSLLDHGPYILQTARKNGKGALLLIENHHMNSGRFELLDRRLPDVFALQPEFLMYYYYPRNVDDPDRQMSVMARHLKTLKDK